jgi:hypothetical protein
MKLRETAEQAAARWAELELLQKHYAKFEDFLRDVIEDVMGFTCTDVQQDIGEFIAYGPQHIMVQAQRGQAKTTVAACFSVWSLIHNPAYRIMIISAGDDMATEVANWIIQIIENMPELACMRPDRSMRDRASTKAYDIHYTLKGPEKSPSVACMGIMSNMQGRRADILIPDDIESSKNSLTAVQRERVKHLTKDFTSINSKGRIIWLGTPQLTDSTYNDLPSRGYTVRIWPGRYPTPEEMLDYEGFIAPYILDKISKNPSLQFGGGPTGSRGMPVDPVIMNEDDLTKKEIDQGAAYFNLQFMLSTKLLDKDRYPLKTANIRFLSFDREEMKGPMTLVSVRNPHYEIEKPVSWPMKDKLYRVAEASNYGAISGPMMYVDPAGGGQNGDETGYAVTGFLAGRIFGFDVGGVAGGLSEGSLDQLTAIALKWKVKFIHVESNYGNGALASVWLPKLRKAMPTTGIENVWEAGQKELRIISTLEPILNNGKLILAEELIQQDWDTCQSYPTELRKVYSFLFQLSRITRDKGALVKDDRLDAFAGACRPWIEAVAQDEDKVVAAAKNEEYRKLMSNPLGNGRPLPYTQGKSYGAPNALSKVGLHRQVINLRRT